MSKGIDKGIPVKKNGEPLEFAEGEGNLGIKKIILVNADGIPIEFSSSTIEFYLKTITDNGDGTVDFRDQDNVLTRIDHRIGHVKVSRTFDLPVPTTEGKIDFNTYNTSSSNGFFTVDSINDWITVNETGMVSIVAAPNVVQDGILPATGLYRIGVGINGANPVKPNWRSHKPSEAGSGTDENNFTYISNDPIDAGTTLRFYHIDEGSGSLDLIDSAYTNAFQASLTFLGKV